MWKDLSVEWKRTFENAWKAFRQGSIPIGAMITDKSGHVIIEGRNETCETHYPNKRTAHAEMYCVRNLDIEKYPDFNEYQLYTTMEPCPMCMGTIVMGGIRHIHVAARDKYCGALHYAQDDPYMKSKNLQIYMAAEELGEVQMVQQSYHEIRRHQGEESKVLKEFKKDYPRATELAMKLYEERYFDKCIKNNTLYSEVYDSICKKLGYDKA